MFSRVKEIFFRKLCIVCNHFVKYPFVNKDESICFFSLLDSFKILELFVNILIFVYSS